MKTIVAGIDFSANSETVVRFSCQLASLLGAELRIVNVFEVFGKKDYTGLDSRANEAVVYRLEQLVAEACRDLDVKPQVQAIATERDPVQGLAEASRTADLLILGKTSRQGFWRLFEGDTIRAMVERIHCPLMVVPGGYEFQAPKVLTVALAAAVPSERAARPVLELAAATDALVLVHHITQAIRDQNADLIAERFPGCTYLYTRVADSHGAALAWAREAKTSPGTWLCLNHRGRVSWMGGLRDDLADRVAAKTEVPVLVLVEPEDTDDLRIAEVDALAVPISLAA